MTRATLDETDEVVARLRESAERLYEHDVYRKAFEEAGLEPSDIDSIDRFRELPMMDASDQAEDITENPPFGSLVDPLDVVRCNFTPSPYVDNRLPVPATRDDVRRDQERLAEAYRSVGVTEDDVILNTAGMMPYPFGWAIAGAAETIGATHIPMGPGDAEEQVQIIRDYDVTVVSGFPSFALELANTAEETLNGVEIVIGGGEPFTAIEGYREEVREAYGGDVTVVDNYGLSEVGFVGFESREEAGMHVFTDRLFPEVVDPETGELVERGEKGELVLTTLSPDSTPVLRFRTGDLTILDKRDSEYGEYILPQGVFGRVDSMKKVKGVKVYPDELTMYVAGVDGLDHENLEVRLTRPEGTTDHVALTVAGDPETVDREEFAGEVRSVLNISVDELAIEPGFEATSEGVVVDDR
ncbi:phenylacetate--CoA ligase family protein [Natrinema caseinilyticum]|uniref:phenylacetate--CoA ligase family protein n=1 Tax=Natrinema caseinilyticum TaxID=2961570 RepID=UPI0020C52F60|nr:AMP-binding protein [Natrinema caseinilyticum]